MGFWQFKITSACLTLCYSLIFFYYSIGWQMNAYTLVIFDQISYYCFHSTSYKNLGKNSKYKQVRNTLET